MKRTAEEYQEYRRGVVRMAQRKRRMKAAESGMCVICCIKKPEKGHKTCRTCREAISKANKKRYAILTHKGGLMA